MYKRNNRGEFTHENKNMLGHKPPEKAWNNKNSKQTRFSKGHTKGFIKGFTPWNKDKDFGGNDTLKRKIMGLSMYKKWRNEIKDRDQKKCVRCGLKDTKLEVDHYPIAFAKIIKEKNIQTVEDARICPLIWDKSNARTLCIYCHKQVTYWQQATRDKRKVFMETLIELAEKDKDIILLIPDVGFSYIDEFAKKFPDRFINTGVTEQFTIIMAAALALDGWRPYVYSMINFVLFRPAEMVRNAIVCHNAPVTLLGVKGSSSYKFLGFSHNLLHENEDFDFCDNIGLKSYNPQTNEEVRWAVLDGYQLKKANYIRL